MSVQYTLLLTVPAPLPVSTLSVYQGLKGLQADPHYCNSGNHNGLINQIPRMSTLLLHHVKSWKPYHVPGL